jgi:hypothetical protein
MLSATVAPLSAQAGAGSLRFGSIGSRQSLQLDPTGVDNAFPVSCFEHKECISRRSCFPSHADGEEFPTSIVPFGSATRRSGHGQSRPAHSWNERLRFCLLHTRDARCVVANVSFKKESEEIMKRVLTGAAVLGFAVLASSSAAAQEVVSRSPIQFGVMGGATIPTGDFNNLVKTGWNAGALLNFGFSNSPVALRVDGSWNQMNYKDFSSVKLRLIDATADAVFSFGTQSPAQFYVLGGAGVYNFKNTGDNNNFDFSTGTQTKFGLNGGVGVKFTAGPVAPFVEARYHYVFSGDSFRNTNGNNSKFQMIPISVGLTF